MRCLAILFDSQAERRHAPWALIFLAFRFPTPAMPAGRETLFHRSAPAARRVTGGGQGLRASGLHRAGEMLSAMLALVVDVTARTSVASGS